VGPNLARQLTEMWKGIVFQSSVRINVGPNSCEVPDFNVYRDLFQSSVRINVGPNNRQGAPKEGARWFQSSVRINVGPNFQVSSFSIGANGVSILRED